MTTTNHDQQEPDFFSFLPLVILIDILSRLPIRTIAICKCVCSSWSDLLRTREFADFHIPKSAPGLVIGSSIFRQGRKDVLLFEFDDQHRYKPLTKIKSIEFARPTVLRCSANGLLLLHKIKSMRNHVLIVCNPITREYIDIPVYENLMQSTYGFGVSGMTRKIKVVNISQESNVLIYVLGTRMWRRIFPSRKLRYKRNVVCLNGNLYWLVEDFDGRDYVSCFDLEAETFRTFSLPVNEGMFVISLSTLGDCLCACYNAVDVIEIWLMKEYEDTKSWTKEFVIRKGEVIHNDDDIEIMNPIVVSKDGDIWVAIEYKRMIYFYNRTKGTEVFRGTAFYLRGMIAMLHTPSFFSLSSFANERVGRF